MKTLDQWLEDSGEENEEQPHSSGSDVRDVSEDRRSSASPVVAASHSSGTPSFGGSLISAHTPTTTRPAQHPQGGLYTQQEETREKMRRLLGTDAVTKATTSSPSSMTTAESTAWPIASPPERGNDPYGSTPVSSNPTAAMVWVAPALGQRASNGGDVGTARPSSAAALQQRGHLDTPTDSSQLPEVEETMKGFGGAGPAYAAVEVMVVDRGTQTVTSEGTQTEPTPISVGPFYTGPYAPAPYTGCVPMHPYTGWGGMPPVPSFGRGVDGRPYRQHLRDYEQRDAAEAAKLREELGMLQNSIDMLIARYNLPPPPM